MSTPDYIMAETVPDSSRGYLTPGKKYPVIGKSRSNLRIIDDEGDDIIVAPKNSFHLDERDWVLGYDDTPRPIVTGSKDLNVTDDYEFVNPIAPDHAPAIAELKECLSDAKKRRSVDDPEWASERWAGYLEGLGSAIYMLEMKTANRNQPNE